MNTDTNILQGLKEGDIKAFKEMINLYAEDMVILAFTLLGDPVKANGLVTDVLYQVWKEGREKEIPGTLAAYLFNEVREACL